LPGIFYAAKMCNLSKGGIYFESDQILYPGEEIDIGLKHRALSSNDPQDYTRVEIKWRKELIDSKFSYGYGAKFKGPHNALLKTIDISQFPERTAQDRGFAAKSDPREHSRELFRKPVIFTCRKKSYQGFISNISRGGAFIATEKKFALGQLIQIVIPGDKKYRDFKIRGWVVRLNPNGFGVKFDRRSGKDRRRVADRRRKPVKKRP